ncbi:Putative ATP-dependent RNA helicase DHX33 [Strongyloides ratti]|uniref:RNA helicase n=1 Tax=Strongyloides ratti TaxID=34506 RepID=A0A090L2V2_STRRB|nr:Putative ATP-dependent RNA helicase DHX33 [Strongyloides ratti]CEF62437.1 Putative ATP-dependent RNA helicase DHX33 [Strongyloides ratti]
MNFQSSVRKRVDFFDNSDEIKNGIEAKKGRFERKTPLPIHKEKVKIIQWLMSKQVTILMGETGCGKSTQIPQFCYEAGFGEKGLIGITQPRRVAAISLAQRVSDEMNTSCGDVVGYRVRFENCTTEKTKIVYLTDGILMREGIYDGIFSKYSCIIIDEVHERAVHTDMLLYMLKCCLRRRETPLTIIIMSATLQAGLFSKYFNDAPTYHIPGRTFPIECFFIDKCKYKEDYFYNSLSTVYKLHRKEPLDESFLVFLTGQDEIEAACRLCNEENKKIEFPIVPIPLYASLSNSEQFKAFQKVGNNRRKVIFSTNIAETSITIPDIKIVIESGKVKQKNFNPYTKTDILKIINTSQAQSFQRAGRAGRMAHGKVYMMFTEKVFHEKPVATEAEILRINLSGIFLEMFKMGMSAPHKLKLIEMPSEDKINSAIEELISLDAIEGNIDGNYKITSIGDNLVKFPVDPKYAAILLQSAILGCLEECLTIVACMSVEKLFLTPPENVREQVESHRRVFETNEGDHIMMLRIYRAYAQGKRSMPIGDFKEWTKKHYFDKRNIEAAANIRKQLSDICLSLKLKRQSCGTSFSQVREALTRGLSLHTAVFNRSIDKFVLVSNKSVHLKIHPSSCLHRQKPDAIVFSELCKTSDIYAKDVSLIDPEWIKC